MNIFEIPYISIAQIPCETIQFVTRLEILCKPDTKIPRRFILYLASDKEKTGILEFPVYIPVDRIGTGAHQQLLQEFNDGAPFVSVSCEDLKVFQKVTANGNEYYGQAEDFSIVHDAYKWIDEEIWR